MASTRSPRGTGKPASRRAPASRRNAPKRTRARRGAKGRSPGVASLLRRGPLQMPVLDQRQRDVLGLALLACAVFMGFVFYGSSPPTPGGRAGHVVAVALGWMLGRARVLTPVAIGVGGAALLLRPVLPALRPLRTGALCVFAAVTLALAAGMLGLSSGSPQGSRVWSSAHLQTHGGIAGQALFELTHKLVQSVGVDILAIFLLLTGVILLTGASIASVIRATGNGLVDSTRMVRSLGERRADERSESRSRPRARRLDDDAPLDLMQPPEPEPEELIVRATHVEAPPRDWREDEPADDESAPIATAEDGDEDLEPEEESEAEEIAGGAHADGDALGPQPLTPQGRRRGSVTDGPDFVWELPDASRLLSRSSAEHLRPDIAGQERTATHLVEALGHFGVEAKVIGTVAGPHITRYELRLAPGTKVGKVAQLKDDLAYALAATDIRILAPIPGTQAVGVEAPNAKRRIVKLGDVFQAPPSDWSPLTVWLGKDVAGKAIGADLAKMPHILVAGTTGAGKSGAINAMLSSVLLRATPHEVRLVLVDPKQVELNHYESIPHLLTPVITSPRMAANALQNLVKEMEQRYGIMSLARTRGLVELNKARAKRGEAPLPYILCVIDELADLMMVAPADVEDSIIRLAQKARAVGIHLVLATQSPRVDVITGMIKANVPSRIAFAVSSQTDSRVILDQNGAEALLGQGDMLFSPVGSSKLQRIQGAYIDEAQVLELTEAWRRQGEPEFHEELLEEVESEDTGGSGDEDSLNANEDPLLEEA